MRRRAFLRSSGAALAALGIGSAGAQLAAASLLPSPAPPGIPRRRRGRTAPLARVNASWDRVIRTTVGLRPHRASGFLLRAEKFGDKTVVHNYGHGGAGMSLAWGTGALAADIAVKTHARRAAVLGCGAPGLAAARQLQRRGFAVTIYAMAVPPDTTSNMSLAAFTPTSGLIDADRRTPAWDAQFRRAVDIAYRQLERMVGPNYGVSWMDTYNATDTPHDRIAGSSPDAELLPARLRAGRDGQLLGPGEHPFPTAYAVRSTTLSIEPSIYLEALVRDFTGHGGRIVIRTFASPADLMALTEPVIVNSTGLGSRALFNDDELIPVKGQLTALLPQPEVEYRISGRLSSGTSVGMTSRRDGIILGNMQDRGNWSLEPDDEVRRRVVEDAIEFFGLMGAGPSSA